MVSTTSNSRRKSFCQSKSVFALHRNSNAEQIFSFQKTQTTFRVALCDSFNTPVAIDALRDLVSKANVYLNSRGKPLNTRLVQSIAQWVGEMLRMFGLGEGERKELGWGQVESSEGNSNVCH